MERRKDSKGRVLKEGESERKDGLYSYRWRDGAGKRHDIYSRSLNDLREKESEVVKRYQIEKETFCGNKTINDLYETWVDLKRGLKANTFEGYKYLYRTFIKDELGGKKVAGIKKSDIRRFYNYLYDVKKLKPASLESVNTVLRQVLDIAVDDRYIQTNPCTNALTELKRERGMEKEKRTALTLDEQNAFINFISKHATYRHWYPLFTFMLWTGMRVGEVTGLTWDDVDFENNTIDVKRTLMYYVTENEGSKFILNSPKTRSGMRTIPMSGIVRDALIEERNYQTLAGIKCNQTIDGITNFVFLNRFGNVQTQKYINKAIKRITRDINSEVPGTGNVQVPYFSCHILRHTFATRMCEAGINVKVVQTILGHSSSKVTLDIYTDVTEKFKEEKMDEFVSYMDENGSI